MYATTAPTSRLQNAPACLICGGETARRFCKDEYWIRACRVCRHESAELPPSEDHVGTVYGDAYFFGGGAGYPDYLAEAKLHRDRGRRYGRLLRRFAPPGAVCDVGAAAGYQLQGLLDAGWWGIGLEPNPRMAAHGREQLGLDVRAQSLEQFEGAGQFDAVTLLQVLPHFVDPRLAVGRVAGMLRPGGVCLVETWDRESLTARLLGTHWHEYSPPSVLHWFSVDGMRRLFADSGLKLVARGRPVRWIGAAHARSLVQAKYAGHPGVLARAVTRLVEAVPPRLALPYPGEDLRWLVFRRE